MKTHVGPRHAPHVAMSLLTVHCERLPMLGLVVVEWVCSREWKCTGGVAREGALRVVGEGLGGPVRECELRCATCTRYV